ncbi:MAG: DNA translocase FtsK [Chloroflexi bacterium]|nr:DNA translocase FtsK [Chloroflexota bacterium]MBT7290667.1 DNA translocase FtsK [Chloroflexota bacterium]
MENITATKIIRWLFTAVFLAVIGWILLETLLWTALPLELFGFGAGLIIIWAAIMAWIILRYHASNLYRRANRWFGAVMVSAAILGALVLFDTTGFGYGGVSLDPDPSGWSLGGYIGQYITGNLGPEYFSGMYRLIVFGVVGFVIMFPTLTWSLISRVVRLILRRSGDGDADEYEMPDDVAYTPLKSTIETIADPVAIEPEVAHKPEPDGSLVEAPPAPQPPTSEISFAQRMAQIREQQITRPPAEEPSEDAVEVAPVQEVVTEEEVPEPIASEPESDVVIEETEEIKEPADEQPEDGEISFAQRMAQIREQQFTGTPTEDLPEDSTQEESPEDVEEVVEEEVPETIIREPEPDVVREEIREYTRVEEEEPSSHLSPIELLSRAPDARPSEASQDINEKRAQLIEQSLESYGVEARVVQINPGPTITQFGIEPGWDRKYKKITERDPDGKVKRDRNGNAIEYFEEISRTRVKVEKITSLTNDLALALAVSSIRFEAPVPGKAIIGLEVPNDIKAVVSLRDCVESEQFSKAKTKTKLALALGKGAGGEVVVGDLAQMPHLLIAGATGSGKTVCLSAIIACLMVNNTPRDMRLLLIDPKRVELVAYNDIPHLISPVVVDLEAAIGALRKVTWEMDNRYKKFAAAGVNNIVNYNKKMKMKERLPYLVVIIDELADLMSASADMVEPAICRIAQLSRATGIHVIIATQRPSVDVITGLIKSNFPTRISFSVPSQIDSRTILDTAGAEKLLGSGDMLYFPIGASKPRRLRGAFVSDKEVSSLVKFWKENRGISEDNVAESFSALEPPVGSEEDPMLEEAKRLAIEHNRISTSFLQRRLRIGYPRAARIVDMLEEEGLISAAEPGKPRQVLGNGNSEDV